MFSYNQATPNHSLSRTIRYLPVYLACGWLLLPLFLVFFGPLDYSIEKPSLLISFILLCILAFLLGYILFSTPRQRSIGGSQSKRRLNNSLQAAGVLAILLVEPSVFAYTGKHIWQVSSIFDQREAYLNLLTSLEHGSAFRSMISLLRGFSAPLIYMALPIGIIHWKNLTHRSRILFLLTVCSIVIFSLFRGTDKEVGDLLIFFISGLAIAHGSRYTTGWRPRARTVRRAIGLLFFLIFLFILIFAYRKISRYDGNLSFCLYNDVACFSTENSGSIFDAALFSLGMLSAYVSQGYYGLSLALALDYNWTFGIGHSPFLISIFSSIIDSISIYQDGLLFALRSAGWDDRYVWSSVFPWLASDLTFYGVPPFLFFIGAIYSRSWLVAITQRQASAIMTFSLLSIFLAYAPANNQLAQSPDYYIATLFWLGSFLLKEIKNV